jgi:GNAT superfamily N-acetyltransferase
MDFTVRAVSPRDGAAIARLHAASWKDAYRGILSDEFLAREVDAERLRVWTARMSEWNPARSFGEIAEIGSEPVGFVCVMADADPAHGALLDNLHVLPGRRTAGIGRRLIVDAGNWVARTLPGTPMHLTVYVANEAARAFYRRRGGIESVPFREREHDGRMHDIVRFVWPEPGKIS